VSWRAWAAFAALGIIWGIPYFFIKLAVQECGLGAEWLRPPRLPLAGKEREDVLGIIRKGIETRPKIGAAVRH